LGTKDNSPIVLFSPLDWGLGHTTRSIPILEALILLKCHVFLACEEGSACEKILKERFPQLHFLPLKGYQISYAKNTQWFAIKLFLQIPKIIAAIQHEKKMVKRWTEQYNFDTIISDNRYGFLHKKVHSVFITHQLQIAAPFSFLEKLIQKINYRYINSFSECWVPDFAGANNIAGQLSHPQKLPATPVEYIGPLCRLKKITKERKYDFLILLSGPEPQRTVLENKFIAIKNKFSEKIMLVRGLPGGTPGLHCDANFTIKNYCDAEELSVLMAQSEFVICRSGYSTIMEILYLQKKSILIPTPGQTEQEYLAKKLMDQSWAYSFSQSSADYYNQIQTAKGFTFYLPQIEESSLKNFLEENILD
jgi:uncharacterized protein (TIGR00661 family)